MVNNEKAFIKKATKIYDRIIKLCSDDRYKKIYSWAGNLYATNGYAIYMIKNTPVVDNSNGIDFVDFEFKSKVVHEDTLENMIRPHLHYNTEFYLPTIKELKAYIKEHGYSRSGAKLFDARYKLENNIYVNAFFLLDALELCKSKPFEWAKGRWSGEKIYLGNEKQYCVCKGTIEIVSADGNNAAWIAPIKAPRYEVEFCSLKK